MNVRLVVKLLGIVALLIGATMVFSLPWAMPSLGMHTSIPNLGKFESAGFFALLSSMAICFVVGAVLVWLGRGPGKLYRKEAMAVVGLSWVLATVLGALPYYFSGTVRGPTVRVFQRDSSVWTLQSNWIFWDRWIEAPSLTDDQFQVVKFLAECQAEGISHTDFLNADGLPPEAPALVQKLKESDPVWDRTLVVPGEQEGPVDRFNHYRIRWTKLSLIDCLFESQSGFSTTGATVICDLEDPYLVQHCILFWRSSTHFLGGLGIIVLFVAILGHGSAGKALMQTEMPGPTKEGSTARMQHAAWLFVAIYCGLNVVLTLLLFGCGMNLFDACCHAFGTMATGGFSTYNKSVGQFDSATIDYTITAFMILAGTNFMLLYLVVLRQPGKLLADLEWRTYIALIVVITLLVVYFGWAHRDFDSLPEAIRHGFFQVVSIITTTGYGTSDFDSWSHMARGLFLMLMFVGGCSGSTGGGMKVIRHVLFFIILRQEIERAYHPRVVRPLRVSGKAVDGHELRRNILIYFALILLLFSVSWLFVIFLEPDGTWGAAQENKLIDSASAVAATLNNIGPGLGTVGATQNYAHFSQVSKILFVWLMMLGRLEIFSILVLFVPRFWRDR